MTRNVTGFLFISEIKMIIRWRVEEYGGVGERRNKMSDVVYCFILIKRQSVSVQENS